MSSIWQALSLPVVRSAIFRMTNGHAPVRRASGGIRDMDLHRILCQPFSDWMSWVPYAETLKKIKRIALSQPLLTWRRWPESRQRTN